MTTGFPAHSEAWNRRERPLHPFTRPGATAFEKVLKKRFARTFYKRKKKEAISIDIREE